MPSAKSFVLLYLHSLFGVIGRRLPHSSAYCDKTLRDHGGGKRRVVICGFAAKPSGGFTTGGFALSPYVPLLGACQGTTRQRWVSDQHQSGPPHGPTADKHTLSLTPLLPILACEPFSQTDGGGGKRLTEAGTAPVRINKG
jgi:hypothetical protein